MHSVDLSLPNVAKIDVRTRLHDAHLVGQELALKGLHAALQPAEDAEVAHKHHPSIYENCSTCAAKACVDRSDLITMC